MNYSQVAVKGVSDSKADPPYHWLKQVKCSLKAPWGLRFNGRILEYHATDLESELPTQFV